MATAVSWPRRQQWNTQGKGGVIATKAAARVETQDKGGVIATKAAVEHTRQRRCLSHEGNNGTNKQRQCLSHEGSSSGNTRERQWRTRASHRCRPQRAVPSPSHRAPSCLRGTEGVRRGIRVRDGSGSGGECRQGSESEECESR